MKKRIIIASIGIHARAIYRLLKGNDKYKIIGFIEKDSEKVGTFFDTKPIYAYKDLKKLDYDKIAIAGVWQNDIAKEIIKQDIKKEKLWLLDDNFIDYYSKQREKLTNKALKSVHKILSKYGINYIIDGSALIYLFRNKKISSCSDVDVMLLSKTNQLEFLYEKLTQSKNLSEFNIKKVYSTIDNKIIRKHDLLKIIITSNCNTSKSEPMVIDVCTYIDFPKYYLLPMDKSNFYYYPKKILGKKKKQTKLYKYRNLKLSIPSTPDRFLSFIYGKNWIKPPKKIWNMQDYLNIIEEKNLNKLEQRLKR